MRSLTFSALSLLTLTGCIEPNNVNPNINDTGDPYTDTDTDNTNNGPIDADNDGVRKSEDCDDNDASVYQLKSFYRDADLDGYTTSSLVELCVGDNTPSGYSISQSAQLDCEDTLSAVNPGATEICKDGLDNDCSGDAPECQLTDMSLGSLTSDQGRVFEGSEQYSHLGWSVATLGDLNSDGYNDFAISKPYLLGNSPGSVNIIYSDLDGFSSFVSITGENNGDNAGFSIANTGDLNGDGVEEILIGAPFNTHNGTDAGAAYLISGTSIASGSVADLADAILCGDQANYQAGLTVAGLQDINNDGQKDFIIGANGYGYNGETSTGAAFVNFGDLNTDIDISTSDFTVTGSNVTDGTAGYHQALSSGDINNDGIPDLIVGSKLSSANGTAAGRADIFFGPISSGSVTIGTSDIQIFGETIGDQLGSVANISNDLNGDGIADIVVCAVLENSNEMENGACYIFFGSTGLSGALYAGIDEDVKITDTILGAHFGQSVALGDINNDGQKDLVISASHNGPIDFSDSASSNGAYIFYGPLSSGDLSTSNADVKLSGENRTDKTGTSLSIGDMNGDGIDDILIGAPFSDRAATDGGAAYLVFGNGM